MANTGFLSPGTVVNHANGGNAWASVNNVKVSDNSYSTVTLPGQSESDWIRAYAFNFNIPSGVTIDGIQVKIERKSQHYAVHCDDNVNLAIGTTAVVAKPDTSTFYTTSDVIATYGSGTDTWEYDWTPSDINDLNIFFSVANKGCCSEIAYIDHIQICVWYGAGDAIFFGMNF